MLERILRRIAAEAHDRLPTRAEVHDLFVKWSNGGATADERVLVEVARMCRDAEGPVLECGSGVTTFIAAIYSRHGVWSLEDHAGYRGRVVDILQRTGLEAQVLHSPLTSFNGYDWYKIDGIELPDRFTMVICDGPLGTTRGGRFGLVPQLKERLSGADLVLDDVDREGERQVMDSWCRAFGVVQVAEVGTAALLRVPESGP
jgi:hypothetical protein